MRFAEARRKARHLSQPANGEVGTSAETPGDQRDFSQQDHPTPGFERSQFGVTIRGLLVHCKNRLRADTPIKPPADQRLSPEVRNVSGTSYEAISEFGRIGFRISISPAPPPNVVAQNPGFILLRLLARSHFETR